MVWIQPYHTSATTSDFYLAGLTMMIFFGFMVYLAWKGKLDWLGWSP
ncbi:MAG: hypothetical protein ABSA75_13410 [Candidatus Bathyarchaeia archaeon]